MTDICASCGETPCGQYVRCRYPYTHYGPAIHGSKLADYLVSEMALREDYPEMFNETMKEPYA